MSGIPSQLVRHVLLAGEQLRHVLDQSDSQCGLNGPRFGVLEVISQAGARGCSQTELAEELGAAESSVSTLVERMRRDGLLLRMRSREDRRCSVLMLTELGDRRLTGAKLSRDQHFSRCIERLSSADQQQLSSLLDRLLLILAETSRLEARPDSETPEQGWERAA